jgi:hypothetical protein
MTASSSPVEVRPNLAITEPCADYSTPPQTTIHPDSLQRFESIKGFSSRCFASGC